MQVRVRVLAAGDEPMQSNIRLEVVKSGRDFHKLKWYYKILHLPDMRLYWLCHDQEWESMKCRGHSIMFWEAQTQSIETTR